MLPAAKIPNVNSAVLFETTDACAWSMGGICCCTMCLCEGSK